jgi:hypothetical protein
MTAKVRRNQHANWNMSMMMLVDSFHAQNRCMITQLPAAHTDAASLLKVSVTHILQTIILQLHQFMKINI